MVIINKKQPFITITTLTHHNYKGPHHPPPPSEWPLLGGNSNGSGRDRANQKQQRGNTSTPRQQGDLRIKAVKEYVEMGELSNAYWTWLGICAAFAFVSTLLVNFGEPV